MLQKLFDKFRIRKSDETVKVTCLGGVGEIGMNLYVYETPHSAVVVDCGVMFADSSMPGVDAIYPDLTYLESIKNIIKAVIFTHGHEDHIGGLVRIMSIVSAPVYTGRFTAELLRHKLAHSRISVVITEIYKDESLKLGSFDVDFIKTPHSIPDTFVLRLSYGVFTALHASDFTTEGKTEEIISRFTAKPVTCLFIDSTNAAGSSQSDICESDVRRELEIIFRQAKGRIFFTTFASNVERLASAVEAAKSVGRKVTVEGAAMERTVGIALRQGLINLAESEFLSGKQAAKQEPSSVLYLAGGCQGENLSSIYTIVMGERKSVKIEPGDLVIFSSRSIPGNEISINNIVNTAISSGADVITGKERPVHVSGHISVSELKKLIGSISPAYFVPIHGEYRHLACNIELAVLMGVPRERCIIMKSGQQLTFVNGIFASVNEVTAGRVYVDFRGDFELDSADLSVRRQIARDGVVVITIDKEIKLHTYGFSLAPEQMMGVISAINDYLVNAEEGETVAETAKRAAKKYFRKNMDRRPFIDVI